jgi:hypothetical protein
MKDAENAKLKQAFALVSEVLVVWSTEWEKFNGPSHQEATLSAHLDVLSDAADILAMFVGPLPQVE